VVAPVSVSTSSNGADWHLGVLELPRSGYNWGTEDFYFSGVFIENGAITTTIGGPRKSAIVSRGKQVVAETDERCISKISMLMVTGTVTRGR